MSPTRFFGSLMVLTAIIAAGLSSCRQAKQDNKKTVVVSIEPLRYFTEQIAGKRFKVVSVVPEGYSPETYEPTPEQLLAVSEAAAYLKVGQLGFETTWLEKISLNDPELRVFDTSDSLRQTTSVVRQAKFDPHTWTSPSNAEVISRNICKALCSIDSAGAKVYRQNLGRLLVHIHKVDMSIRNTLKNLPNRTFVTAHPSLTYFADDYGLRQLSIEKDGKEPTPAQLAEFIVRCRQEGVKVILVQPEFSRESATVLAREIGARVAGINPLSYHWDTEMINTAKALRGSTNTQ